jgi:hypothetical protein
MQSFFFFPWNAQLEAFLLLLYYFASKLSAKPIRRCTIKIARTPEIGRSSEITLYLIKEIFSRCAWIVPSKQMFMQL